MYQTDFLCTYKLIDDKEDSDLLYQLQLLQAFDYYHFAWSNEVMKREVQILYDKIKDDPQLHKIIRKSPFFISEQNNQLGGFISLFAYQTFDILHKWLCEYFSKKVVTDNTQNELLSILNNYPTN